MEWIRNAVAVICWSVAVLIVAAWDWLRGRKATQAEIDFVNGTHRCPSRYAESRGLSVEPNTEGSRIEADRKFRAS